MDQPWYVKLSWVFAGPIYAFLGMLVSIPTAFIIALIKLLPGLVRAYRELWSCCIGNIRAICFCCSVLLFIIGVPFILLIGLLVCVVFIGVGAGMGIAAVGTGYNHGYRAGLYRIIHNVYELDEHTNQAIFNRPSCFQPLKLLNDNLIEDKPYTRRINISPV